MGPQARHLLQDSLALGAAEEDAGSLVGAADLGHGLGEFLRQLADKCIWYGSRLVTAPRSSPSSKRCSGCGYVLEQLPLHIREWTCPACGRRQDRDRNAAVNLLALVGSTASSARRDACGERRLEAARSVLVGEAGSNPDKCPWDICS
jgi:putative transposase